MNCPYCGAPLRQVKAGHNRSGSQVYKCQHCQRRYTPVRSTKYPPALREQAVQPRQAGMGYPQIAARVEVNLISFDNGVKQTECPRCQRKRLL